MFDDEIGIAWCLGDTWRCTPTEVIGLWSVVLFYTTVLIVTVVHSTVQKDTGIAPNSSDGDELCMVVGLMVYFFTFALGCLLWVAAGVRWVHPIQCWQVQLLGSAILVACAILFVASHVDLGEQWDPQPAQRARHQLVTHGVFRYARHPMYAIFLWASIGTLLATLNWLIAWCVFGSVLITLRRIETEERILVELFGGQYLEYRRRVSALGPPWCCLGFDREML